MLKSTIFQLLFTVLAVLFSAHSFAVTASGLKLENLTDTIYGYWAIDIIIVMYSLVIIKDLRPLRKSNLVQSGSMQILL